ncbi:MAG: hypothetical protein U1V55_07060 [Planktothrix rubescens PR222]
MLLDNHQYSGAYYLSGYVIECALKACIAKKTQQLPIPITEFYNGYSNIGKSRDRRRSKINRCSQYRRFISSFCFVAVCVRTGNMALDTCFTCV